MHFPSFTDISMVIYHYGAIAARGSEGVKSQDDIMFGKVGVG